MSEGIFMPERSWKKGGGDEAGKKEGVLSGMPNFLLLGKLAAEN
jgi:hypothetical protein